MATTARDGGGSCFRPGFRPGFHLCFFPCCRSCCRSCFIPCCRSCFYSCNVSDRWRVLLAFPCNVSNRWRTLSRLASCQLSSSHSLECLLLASRSLECLPPTPLNELKIETHSNFNAIYNFEIDSIKRCLPLILLILRREKVGVDKLFKATHKRVSTWQ